MANALSAQAREALHALAGRWVTGLRESGALVGPQGLQQVEELAEEARSFFGECVQGVLLAALTREATYEGSSRACSCGKRARFVGYRGRWLKTTCGEVRVERAYYHCGGCKRGQAPWDGHQGLNERCFSPRLKGLVCQTVGRLTYGEGVSLLRTLRLAAPSLSSAEAIIAEVGGRIRADETAKLAVLEQEQCSALAERLLCQPECRPECRPGCRPGCRPADEAVGGRLQPTRAVCGQRLYVEADAAKAHIDGEWREVKVGALLNVRPNAKGIDTPSGSRRTYLAAQCTAEELGHQLRVRAREWDADAYEQLAFLADGAESLWRQAEQHFPAAQHMLDFYHASEHVWELSRALYRQEDSQQKARGERWAKERVHSLWENGPDPLLRALRRRRGGTPAQREALRLQTGYFARNRHRMHYPTYRASGWMVGSGPIEAACKVVVKQRLGQAGMRWSGTGADRMLAVRTALLSGDQDYLQRMARAA